MRRNEKRAFVSVLEERVYNVVHGQSVRTRHAFVYGKKQTTRRDDISQTQKVKKQKKNKTIKSDKKKKITPRNKP